jgi:hypothetical protein
MSKKPFIINISGKARHGKDTFAKYLMNCLYEKHGKHIQIIKFGDEVKEKAEEVGWNGKKDENGRTLLQFIGDFFRKYIDKDYWVKKAYKKINNDNDYIIIPDTRYLNEIMFFKDRNYLSLTLCIQRYNKDGSLYNELTDEQQKHASETALDDYGFDYYIKAYSGDVDTLEKDAEKIDKLLEGGING